MNFKGYLLKPNGVILPNKYIDVSSYKATPVVRRLIDSWYDGNDELHEEYSQHTTSKIVFTTNGLRCQKMREFISYFPTRNHLSIEYYDDDADIYRTGTFKVSDFTFERYKIRGLENIYKPLEIVLTTY